jgi:hypothetical protein
MITNMPRFSDHYKYLVAITKGEYCSSHYNMGFEVKNERAAGKARSLGDGR